MSWTASLVASCIELFEERGGLGRRVLLGEPLHNVGSLLPRIHSLLVLLVSLEQEDINHSDILDVAVAVEHGTELCAEQSRRHVQRVQLADLRSLVSTNSLHGRGRGKAHASGSAHAPAT